MPLPRFKKLDPPRRHAILAAAATEFSEHGFQHASYNRIIAGAGMSKGAMYYYFADKDDLYRTVLDVALELWFAAVGSPTIATDAEGYWREAEEVYRRSLRLMFEDPVTAAICMSITRARAQLEGHPSLLELNERMMQWMDVLLTHGQTVGAIRKDLPRDLLLHVGLAVADAGDRWLFTRWDELTIDDVDETAEQLVGIMRRIAEEEG